MLKRFTIILSAIVLSGFVVSAQGIAVPEACRGYMASRLAGGMYARVTPGDANNLRESPTVSSPVVGQIEPGEVVYVTSAPTCADGFVWWQVGRTPPTDISDFAYTAEGADGEYWLEPYYQAFDIAAERSSITPENASSLTQIGQVEHGLVSQLIWSSDGSKLAVNSVGAVWVYDVNVRGSLPVRLTPNPMDTNLATGIAFGLDGATLAAAGSVASSREAPQSGYQQWQIGLGDPSTLGILLSSDNFANVSAASPDLTRAATAEGSGEIILWELTDGTPIASLLGHSLVGKMLFNPTSTILASTGGEGMAVGDTTVRLWDAVSGAAIGVKDIGSSSYEMAFSPDGSLLAVGTVTDGIPLAYILDATTAEAVSVIALRAESFPSGLSFSPDGSILVVGASVYGDFGPASTMDFYEVATSTPVNSVAVNRGLLDVAFSPDGTLIAVAYEDLDFW